MNDHPYTGDYFSMVTSGSLASARKLVPLISSFVQPKSVVDVGCGAGAWLRTWQEEGVGKILGIDGFSGPETLLIDPSCFIRANLAQPIHVQEKFDLVMSLEVAEHIPSEFAGNFITSLCTLGDVILFSAAIPGQGGVHHVNEQYPPYWAAIFSRNGFSGYDCVRSKIWDDQSIDTCYRQNLLFFVRDSARGQYPAITGTDSPVLSLVHPEHFQKKEQILQSYKNVLRTPFHAGWHFIKSFFRFFRPNKNRT